MKHTLDLGALVTEWLTGTSASQADVVFSQTLSAAASPQTLDLRGGQNSELTGAALNFVEVIAVIIRNKSTTATENLTIGAGSNPWGGMHGATTHTNVIGPGGLFVWTSPIDGVAATAGTADILTVDPGADTISFDAIIIGRSA